MVHFYTPDMTLILPEILLIVTAFAILIAGVFQKTNNEKFGERAGQFTLLSILWALVIMLLDPGFGSSAVSFEGQLMHDDYIYFARVIILIGSGAILAVSFPAMKREHLLIFEYPALILFAIVGMLIMVAANDLMTLFIGLEIQALSLYVIAALNRDQVSSSEAALKYYVLGGLATSLFLYGASLIYGFTGSTNYEGIASIFRTESIEGFSLGVYIGLTFIIGALAFKVSSVPFHMWTPDVYQGCPTPITAFIAAVPKFVAMIVLLRLLYIPFMLLYEHWQMLIIILSAGSMIVGAFAPLRQYDLKRLLAYSAIGQIGYALLGLAAGNEEGLQAVFIYLLLYMVMIIGTFGCLLALRGKGHFSVQSIEDLSGISNLYPKISFMLAIFMFSFAGIPPLGGFFAKLYVFKAALGAGLFNLAIVGVLTSVISTFYYIKIVKVMYFDDVPETPHPTYAQTLVKTVGSSLVLNLCMLIILFFFIYPTPFAQMAQIASLILPQ